MNLKFNRSTLGMISAAALVTGLTACGDDDGGSSEGGAFQPSQTVTMLVPFAAGGGSDIAGRATASGFEEVADVSITVRNVDGGSGAVGYAELVGEHGNPNILLPTETALVALPITQDVPFTYEDFTPIMLIGEDFTLIVVRDDSELTTCADLVESADSGRVLVGITGMTGLDNIVFTQLEEEGGAEFERVPFESGGELLTAVLGGQVEAISVNPGEVEGQLESGDLRPLCAAADQRYEYEDLADVPTAQEQGLDVSFAQFRGVLAAGGISDEARDYWIGVAQEYAETDSYLQYVEDNKLQADPVFGDDFTEVLRENDEILRRLLDE